MMQRIGLVFVLLLLAAGCARMPTPEPAVPAAERAAERAAAGDYAEAARLYVRAAKRARGDERNRLHLAAGEAAARAGDTETAEAQLDAVDTRDLNDEQRARLRLARIETRIAGLPPEEALRIVSPPESGTPPETAARAWQLRARLLLEQGRIVEGVHALTQRDVWLVEPERARANDERIWRTLTQQPPEDLDRQALDRVDETTRGWVRLARLAARDWPGRAALEDALIDWERRYPGHPAARMILPKEFDYSPIVPGDGFAVRDGRGLALALPFTGRFSEPAAALRDGFLAAYYASEPPRPRLRLYDTNAVPDMAALLERARTDGVGLLVGPLDKDHVAELHAIDDPGLSVLALNYTETVGGFPGFYQFGLAPEDEAEAAAEQAVDMGLFSGLALVPDNEWGTRLLRAFGDALDREGGTLVDYAVYDPGLQDYSTPIKTLLEYEVIEAEPEEDADGEENGESDGEESEDESEDKDIVARLLERGRRQDASFVFIAAQPAQARLIRSQLRFYHALHLPVLATSHVYTGRIDPDRDSDLNGLMFPDMPWTLTRDGDVAERRARVRRLWPDTVDRYPRLFALGWDAWRVQGRLRRGDVETGKLLAGDTGELHLQANGEIHRRLEWAQFARGRPAPLRVPLLEPLLFDLVPGP